MTDDTLARLRQALMDCENEYEYWCATNTWGKSAAELVAIDLGYRRASQNLLAAQSAYDAALDEAIRKEPS
jgi:hypothetical protein